MVLPKRVYFVPSFANAVFRHAGPRLGGLMRVLYVYQLDAELPKLLHFQFQFQFQIFISPPIIKHTRHSFKIRGTLKAAWETCNILFSVLLIS